MDLQPRSFHVGDVRVTRIPELLLRSFRTTDLIPDWMPKIADRFDAWMVPECLDETHTHVVISTHAWLVQTSRHTILVDTAVGNDKPRALGLFNRLQEPFLDHLAAAGVAPEEVDHVLSTHLHTDHVGWNTRLVDGCWRPTFRNATYVLPRRDLDRVQAMVASEGKDAPKAALYFDSILPVLEAGQAQMVDAAGEAVLDGTFVYYPTPGHCAGHMSIGFSSYDQHGFFAGDVMHHPIQVVRPDWSSVCSEDPSLGRVSRLWALDHAFERGALVFTSHFAASGAGRVSREDRDYNWTFA